MVEKILTKALQELDNVLSQLNSTEYTEPCGELSHATIGEHTRHSLEMLECLTESYNSGIINYDNRKRDTLLETYPEAAREKIVQLLTVIIQPDKNLKVVQQLDGKSITADTTYKRELLYNLDHCIHHQALIKVALQKCDDINISNQFGVASSTISYRNQCAQ